MDETTFENVWQKISLALVGLKIPQQEINDLKSGFVGPEEKNYVQILKEWISKEDICKPMLANVTSNVELILKQQEGLQQSIQNLEQITKQNSKLSEQEKKLLQKLAKHNFNGKTQKESKALHRGTRQWLKKEVENWFATDDESTCLLIKAGPGFGKSVFAAKICELFQKSGKLAACHFCDFRN